MNNNHRKLLASMLCTAALFAMSFTSKPGGDSFTIFLNDKLLIETFVHSKRELKTISLDDASAGDVVKVYYSHCGETGIGRKLAVKDDQNKILRSWSFANVAANDNNAMSIPVREIINAQKIQGTGKLSLVYSANQLKGELMLVTLKTQQTRASW